MKVADSKTVTSVLIPETKTEITVLVHLIEHNIEHWREANDLSYIVQLNPVSKKEGRYGFIKRVNRLEYDAEGVFSGNLAVDFYWKKEWQKGSDKPFNEDIEVKFYARREGQSKTTEVIWQSDSQFILCREPSPVQNKPVLVIPSQYLEFLEPEDLDLRSI